MKKLTILTVLLFCVSMTACTGNKTVENETGIAQPVSSEADSKKGQPQETASETPDIQGPDVEASISNEEEVTDNMINIQIGDNTLVMKPADNSSAEAFIELIKDTPLTVAMQDYANFEKVGDIGTSLPRNDEDITTVPGDVILYQGKAVVIYYDQNSWNFTRLGRIQNLNQDELKQILSNGNITATFSIAE